MLLVIASPIYGQPRPNNPHIGYVYPAGGQRGTTFFVVVGGQAMDGVGSAQLSGRGVQVTVKSHTRPLAPKEHHDLMNKRDELEKQRAAAPGGDDRRRGPGQPPTTNSVSPTEWTAAQEKWLYEIRVRLANSTTTGRLPNPAIAEIVRFQVTVSPDAELGERELRLVTPYHRSAIGGASRSTPGDPLRWQRVGEDARRCEKPHEPGRGAGLA